MNKEHGLLGHTRSLAFLINKEYKIGREKDEKELRIVDIMNEIEINNIKYRSYKSSMLFQNQVKERKKPKNIQKKNMENKRKKHIGHI